MVFLLHSVARCAWCARAISLAVSTNVDGRDALLIAFLYRWAACFAALAGQSKPASATLEGPQRENSDARHPPWDRRRPDAPHRWSVLPTLPVVGATLVVARLRTACSYRIDKAHRVATFCGFSSSKALARWWTTPLRAPRRHQRERPHQTVHCVRRRLQGDHKGRPYIKKTEPRLQGSARFHPTVTFRLTPPLTSPPS